MEMNDDKDKYDFFFQDMNVNDKALAYKIFKYFYSLSQEQKDLSIFLISILMLIETIQFISFSFTTPHYDSWKMNQKNIRLISNIVGAFRLSMVMKYLDYKIYTIILILFVAIIFGLFIILLIQILFDDSSSKLYRYGINIIHYAINIISIALYIPITEIILMPTKCDNGTVYGIKNSETCWESMHYLNVTLGCIGAILLFIWCIFILNFDFYPFQKLMSTTRINSNNDILILIIKLIHVLQNSMFSNEYISLIILLISSITNFYISFYKPTYNNNQLELLITIRNLVILWTNCVLFLSKIFKNFIANGFIYLLVFGYPIIIFLSIVIYKDKDFNFPYLSENKYNLKDYITKAKINIKLIDSFLERNKNMRVGNEDEGERNIILLKGNIQVHNISCTDQDCPLTKFINNEGNYNIQKQCLLNYMNNFFNQGIKKYPNNFNLLILFIHFNFDKRFNLNSVKSNIIQLKKIDCTFKQKFIIYCIEQNIKNMKNNINMNFNNNQDNESQIDMIEQKYQKLKYLIENSIKLYGEFWGIFSTTVTNNINTNKLYSIGEKLNKYLNEINNLWDNDLKNRKISKDYKNIVQLYYNFLVEILWNQKKSKEVYKKLNDESLNNYNQIDNREKQNNNGVETLESLIDNQDFLLFCDSDEKGNCKINQCSASFSHYLGYKKYDIIGKPLEIIVPNIILQSHNKYLEECIKLLHNGQNNQKDLEFQENDSNKNSKLIMVKSRMGYIFPFYSSCNVSDDNDYSDSFLIKIKLENKEPKSDYSYNILTNTEFNIENISSSSINMGLSLDLLRKYVVKMDVLTRSEDNKSLNLYDKYSDYEEESKIITWIFPDLIYPKDASKHINEDEIEELKEKSNKKKFNLKINSISFNQNENVAYAFKFTEISYKKKKKKNANFDYCIPKIDKNLILFDFLNLNYIRGLIVEKKSENAIARNIEEDEAEESKNSRRNSIVPKGEKTKKKVKSSKFNGQESSEEDNNKNYKVNLLTKEKIMELQVNNYEEIQNFIYLLPTYGSEVSLERFRPNGEKYSASKITEPLLKINLNAFCKRMKEKYNLEELLKRKKSKNININNVQLESSKETDAGDHLLSSNSLPSTSSEGINTSSQGEEMNKGLASDSSSSLENLFKAYSIKYMGILMFVTFLLLMILVILEFLIINNHINRLKIKIDFLYNGYIILNDMVYTKYFVTEGVIAITLNSSNITYSPISGKNSYDNFFQNIKTELSFYRQEFTETYNNFTSNDVCEDYHRFISETKITLYTITVNSTDYIDLIFNSAMTRIPASINDLALDPTLMEMKNRGTFELMQNLINEYYVNWEKVIIILLNDCIKETNFYIPLLLILICSFIVSFIIYSIFLKLLKNFLIERERPINLFFTLKKKVFENLKNAAENFSNKILNKFFGNEEGEEESEQDYQTNIEPNDINIVKFKAANENYSSLKNVFIFIEMIFIMLSYILVYLVCFVIHYIDFKNRMKNIFQFINLFDRTNIAQTDFILALDIFKSYLYDKSISILNKNETNNIRNEFIKSFYNISEKFTDLIIYSSKTKSFLKGEYLKNLEKYLYGDISEIVEQNFYEKNKEGYRHSFENGLVHSELKIFEIIRFMAIRYCDSDEIENFNKNISFLLEDQDKNFNRMNTGVQSLLRYWYNYVIKLMIDSFYDYKNATNMYYIVFFICLIVFDILVYSFIWRFYEQKLNFLLKGSIDLINLIPQEIKNIIIEKLNE